MRHEYGPGYNHDPVLTHAYLTPPGVLSMDLTPIDQVLGFDRGSPDCGRPPMSKS